MESKKDIYDLIPQKFYPRTFQFKAGTSEYEVLRKLLGSKINFPLVGKPDIGMRGMAVKKLNNFNELYEYILSSKVDFLIQEFIAHEMEVGIFYYRLPNANSGNISGIVSKEFLTVEGDGNSTILQLLKKEKRFILQLNDLKKQVAEQLSVVLPKGTKKVLVPYGNHSRGAKFIDASDRINDRLVAVIDKICRQIEGFYYGRMDIRFNSWEELGEGNLSIIELNGAGSEPTHIYDPKHSIFFAWKEIIRHWNILYKISKQNRNKTPYMNFNSGIKMFRENLAYLKLLNSKAEMRA